MQLRGIRFGDIHTGTDWGLTLSSKSIDPPTPKTYFLSIDGRDGDLDLTEALTGDVKYENRNMEFEFVLTDGTYLERENLIQTITNYLHGKKLSITLDDDTSRYYTGRCEVSDISNSLAYGELTVSANCEPYKQKFLETVVSQSLTSTKTSVDLTNSGTKTLIPEIVVSGSVNIEFDETSVALSTGTYQIAELQLRTGTKVVQVYGSGEVSFKYREAVL